MTDPKFNFTITDLARFLGKSPVTLRGWERKGLVTIPRDGADRKLNIDEVLSLAERAYELKRINDHRLNLIHNVRAWIKIIESENS